MVVCTRKQPRADMPRRVSSEIHIVKSVEISVID